MRRALLIGVRRYDRGYPDTIGPAVAADLQAMRRLMIQLNVEISATVGLGEQTHVSQTDIRAAAAEFIIDAGPDDDLIIYFTGHGRQFAGVSYVVPSAANPRLPDQPGYLVPIRFETEIRASRARSVTFVADLCRSEDADVISEPDEMKRTNVIFIFATQPATVARTTSGTHPASVFTKSLVEVLPTLPEGIRLNLARTRIQERLDQICEHERFPAQTIDVVANVDEALAPFPLFHGVIATVTRDRWTQLIRPIEADVLGPLEDPTKADFAAVAAVLACADRLHHEASTSVAGDDLASSVSSPWIEPLLPERLVRAMTCVVPGGLSSEFERLLFVGLVAATEAAFRAAEDELLGEGTPCLSTQALLASHPTVSRVIANNDADSALLTQWVVHLASIRECVLERAGNLRAKIGEVLRASVPDLQAPDFIRTADYLLECIKIAFDTSLAAGDVDTVREVGSESVNGRRIAMLLRITWALGLDSRVFSTDAGLHLVHEGMPVRETLDSLQQAVWKPVDSLLDLSFWNQSAALDLALRQLVANLNNELLLHKQQLDGVLHQANIPLATAVSRLRPDKNRFRLPHITFEISASETQALLMGVTLYRDPALAVREMYQNAIDACHYRARRIRHEQRSGSVWSPRIEFRLVDEGSVRYLECRDNGIGMSETEIREAFARTGRRFRDLPEFIEESAEWLDRGSVDFEPISQFGIGVLSYFMIADEIELRTTRISRDLLPQPSLHVAIRGGAGLFKVRPAVPAEPSEGGTVVRLRLLPEARDLDVRKALGNVVRAPTIPVTLGDFTWQPGELYTEAATVVDTIFSSPGHGVFFHEGLGEFLVNGIPIGDEERERPVGCTISLGRWAKPVLSVDRRTMLTVDQQAIVSRIRAAATEIEPAGNVTATVNWLTGLYRTDAGAANIFYHKLRDMPIRLHSGHPAHDEFPLERKALEIVLKDSGFSIDDPLILSRSVPRSSLTWFREEVLFTSGESVPHPGLPRFDHLLATLASDWGPLKFFTFFDPETPPAFDADTPPSDFAVYNRSNLGSDQSVEAILRVADVLDVTLGAAAAFAWAVSFIERPVLLLLSRRCVEWSGRNTPEQWHTLSEHPIRFATALSTSRDVLQVDRIYSRLSSDDASVADALFGDFVLPDALDRELAGPIGRALKSRRVGRRGWWTDPTIRQWATRFVKNNYEVGTTDLVYGDGFSEHLPTADLSDAARTAASRDLDGLSPFYKDSVPAESVITSGAMKERNVRDIAEELTDAGFTIVPEAVDWEMIVDIIRENPGHFSKNSMLTRVWVVLGDLTSLAWASDLMGELRLRHLLRRLAAAGLSEYATRLADLELPDTRTLREHGKVLTGVLSAMTIDVHSLAFAASATGKTYAATLADLRSYAPVVREYKLPDTLGHDVAAETAEDFVVRFFHYARDWNLDERAWVWSALRVSVIENIPVSEVVDRVAPLLASCNEDASSLRALSDVLPGQVTFDDLLVLGCMQFRAGSVNPRQIAALCRPFAHSPEALLDRAERLLSLQWLCAQPEPAAA